MTITIIKKKINYTFKSKTSGKEIQAHGYFIQCDNGKLVMIKPVYKEDYNTLDFISQYVNVNK